MSSLMVGSAHVAVRREVRLPFPVSEHFTGIYEISAEMQKLNNDVEICLLLPHFFTVILLESLCASSPGALPWQSLVYLGSMRKALP